MARLIKEIVVGKKTFKQYELKKENLIAGSCPECLHPVTYYENENKFACTNKECSFIANENGFMIYSTEMKNKGIKKLIKLPCEDILSKD